MKELKLELRKIRLDLHRMDKGLTTLQVEFGFTKWFLGSLLVVTVTGIATGIWWAATIRANFKALESSTSDRFAEMNQRMDKFESSINMILEQTKAKP